MTGPGPAAVAAAEPPGAVGGAALRARRFLHALASTPPRQLLRRAGLLARLRLAPRLGGYDGPPPPLAAATPPVPPLPPRPDRIAGNPGGGWRLRLPWGEAALAEPPPWRPAGPEPEAAAVANNLQYMEFLESLGDADLAAFVAAWIEANPLKAPGATRFAWRPYNLSLRAASWARELARRGDRLDPALRARMAASLAAQLRFLAAHLETDLRGNHLVKNLKALLWGGAVLAGPEAAGWRALGERLLASELAEQILPDGCHYERSPPYHGQVLADLLECRALLPAGPLRDRLDGALARMARAALLLAHPDGLPAGLNDGGLTMAPPPGELAAAVAELTGAAVEAPEAAAGPFALPDAGYWGLAGPGERLILDCGPLGPRYLPGHGHCDLLALEWSTGGRRILVDQGTYQYAAGPRRALSRGTASHNTVQVGDAEQHDVHGAFRCGRRATPRLLAWREEDGGSLAFAGTHDGFADLAGRPRHVREVEARPGEVRIRDRVEGGAGQACAARLLLHPGCAVEVGGTRARLRTGGVEVALEASAPLSAEPAEWYPDLYVARPATRLVLGFGAGGPPAEVVLRRVAG